MPLFQVKVVTTKFTCRGLVQADTKDLAVLITKEQLKFHTSNFVQAKDKSAQIPASNSTEVSVEVSAYADPIIRFEWDLNKVPETPKVDPSTLQSCIDIVQAYSSVHHVTANSTWLDCELDSLDMMEIVMALENKFDICLNNKESWSTVQDLTLQVQAARKRGN